MSLDRTTPHPGADRGLPRLGARAATAATVLALTAGTLGAGSLAAGTANAAQTSPRVSAAAVAGTGLHTGLDTGAVEERRARTCQEAKQDLRKAKKSVKKARKAKHNRATKVSRAKKRVEKRKNRRDKLCATGGGTTTPGQVQDEVDESRDALGSLPLDQLGALLPAELTGQLDAATAQLQGLLGQLEAGIPGADAGELAEILAALQAMDVPGLVAAVQSLLGELTGGAFEGADPAAVSTVLTTLLGGLPGGTDLPGADLGQLAGALAALQGALGAFDPAAGPAGLLAAAEGLATALTGLAGQLDGADLGPLLGLFTELQDLGALSGADPTGVFAQVLEALVGELGSTDFLGQLGGAIDAGTLALLLGSLGDVLGDLLGGLLGGLPGLPLPRAAG